MKRIFLIVLDSVGIGSLPDAAAYGDEGADTLAAAVAAGARCENLRRLGLGNVEGVSCLAPVEHPEGAFGRLAEASAGKDTTIGHWEIAGLISPGPLPVYPDGFPEALLAQFSRRVGRGVLCNRPYSGTDVIRDFGQQHLDTGDLIVYTSADSVFQVAAHEEKVPLEELYRVCETARALLTGAHAVGRVIARPFAGSAPDFVRTANRHDYSLEPPGVTLLDRVSEAGMDCIGVGKITDIFAGRGVTETIRTKGNADGLVRATALLEREFHGLCFINLVDFDMLYGHRNDAPGYAAALEEFDGWLPGALKRLGPGDLLLITADHGCDPAAPGTDHTREYVPLLAAGPSVRAGADLGTRGSFSDIAATALELLGLPDGVHGESFASIIRKE